MKRKKRRVLLLGTALFNFSRFLFKAEDQRKYKSYYYRPNKVDR